MGRGGKYSGSSSESGGEATSGRRLCRSKNAQMARENRVRKKKYVEALERRLGSLKDDNKELRRLLGEQASYVAELQQDVRYLRAALNNSRPLARLLGRLASRPEPGPYDLELEPPPEPFAELLQDDVVPNSDHNYTSHLISDISNEPLKDVGICLHVSNDKMSLEFCSICNERAIKNFDFINF